MVAHLLNEDLFRAAGVFDGILDPGDAGYIRLGGISHGRCPLRSTTAETRTVDAPGKPGLELWLEGVSISGNITVTVTGGYNAAGSTTMTFTTSGNNAHLRSMDVAGTVRWELVSQSGLADAADVLAAEISIADAGSLITATNVEDALQEVMTVDGEGAKNGATVTVAEAGPGDMLHKTTLTLANTPVVLTDEAGAVAYGGVKVYDMPAGAIMFVGATVNLSLALNAAGVNADWDGDVSMGTVTADNTDSGNTTALAKNIVPSTATPQAVTNAVANCHAQSTSSENAVVDGTATAVDVYLNLKVDDADHDVANTATAILASGTITLFWINLGDY